MKLNIALLPGDGIGPEVVDQAVKAVNAVLMVSSGVCMAGLPPPHPVRSNATINDKPISFFIKRVLSVDDYH